MPNITGRLVAGRYLLDEHLGKGGMGTVWRATDNVLKRQVAIKEVKLPPVLSNDDSDAVKSRVMREAQTAARLSHPCVVTVFDVIEEDGDAFIVMELVEAPSLEELVKTAGPLPPQQVAEIGLDVLSALEMAHAQGITHRDVKPANVMIPDGTAKLADFGIASVKGDPHLTATGLILGSPAYMAPEQASQDTAGPQSDLWALGGTLYFAVEGVPPFDKGQVIPTLTAVINDEPRSMQRAGALAPVILALLSKEPGARPDANRLRPMLQEAASAPAERVVGTAGAMSAATAADPAPTTPVEPDPRSPTATQGALQQDLPARPSQPRRAPAAEPHADRRPWFIALGALVLVALVAAFLIPTIGDDNGSPARSGGRSQKKNQAVDEGASGQSEGSSKEGGSSSAGSGSDPDATAPEDFTTYDDGSVGYTISYPSTWEVVPIDTRTDFREAGTGRYLRIDYTTEPGPDAYEKIEESIEPSFASSHDDYERIQLTRTEFAGSDNAALWEYTYEGQHAYNLQFVTEDGEYGFALNFQTPEDRWEDSQDLWSTFQETFQLP